MTSRIGPNTEGTMATAPEFSLDCVDQHIVARYEPAPEAAPPGKAELRTALAAKGWDAAVIDEMAVMAFFERCQAATEAVQAEIGEVRDGSVTVEVDSDGMAAWLTLVPPRGGKAVSAAEVREAIVDRGVAHGLKVEALKSAVAAGRCDSLQIACGEPPAPGTRTRFINLLDEAAPAALTEDDNSIVDYRNMGKLELVSTGTALMRRIPAVQGLPGKDVLGRPVPPVPVADPPFASGLVGVEIDPGNAELLRATIDGAPSFLDKGVNVKSLVDVAEVGLDSGNIAFDGTLHVKGDVRAGMKVQVGGDLVVAGTVEAAEIVAGGNVTVKGGIIGKAGSTDTASIRCRGSVQARFIEAAHIVADGNVQAERGIHQSDVSSGDSILVGNNGVIGGGRVSALHSIRAGSLGLPAGIPTLLQAGTQPALLAERDDIERQRKAKLDEFGKLLQIVTFCEQHPEKANPETLDKARRTLGKLRGEQRELDGRLADIQDRLTVAAGALIEATRHIHPGVQLQIGQRRLVVDEERRGGKAVLKGMQVVID